MLDQIRYMGYEVKKTSFEDFNLKTVGGFVQLEANIMHDVDVYDSEDGNFYFSMPVVVEVSALDEGRESKVFSLEHSIGVDFIVVKADGVSVESLQSLIKAEIWFFKNYIDLSVKTSLDKIFSETRFSGVSIPNYSDIDA